MGTRATRLMNGTLSLHIVIIILVYSLANIGVNGAVPVDPVYINLSVSNVTSQTATLSWHPVASLQSVRGCVVRYKKTQARSPSKRRTLPAASLEITLRRLHFNCSYSAVVLCPSDRNTFQSNSVQFTTYPEVEDDSSALNASEGPVPEVFESQSRPQEQWPRNTLRFAESLRTNYLTSRKGDEEILVVMNQRHMSSPRRNPHSANASTNVILGAVCGVVGFLIINVTVVMVVRQYSLRRARRRRFYELQLEQHGGYLFNIDDLLDA